MDKWVYDNAMYCIAWIAQELVQNHEHIASEELWYEESDPQDLTVRRDQGMYLFLVDHLRQICPADLRNDEDTNDDSDVLQTIRERFAQEHRAQRLHKRRQRRRRSSQINSDSVMQRSAKRSPSMMSDESQDEVRGTGRRQPHTSPASKQAASPVFSSGSEQPTPSTTKPATPPGHSSVMLAGIRSSHPSSSRQRQNNTVATPS